MQNRSYCIFVCDSSMAHDIHWVAVGIMRWVQVNDCTYYAFLKCKFNQTWLLNLFYWTIQFYFEFLMFFLYSNIYIMHINIYFFYFASSLYQLFILHSRWLHSTVSNDLWPCVCFWWEDLLHRMCDEISCMQVRLCWGYYVHFHMYGAF